MEVDMPLPIARTNAAALPGGRARVFRAFVVAVLAVGLQVPVGAAAAGMPTGNAVQRADPAPAAAIAAGRAPDGFGTATVPLQADDGEDHFDEGDDEWDCDHDGERRCGDDSDERGDDEEAGCADYDDGEDRCLDDGDDHYDEGDDEFDAGCVNFDDGDDRCLDNADRELGQPVPTRVSTDPVVQTSSSDVLGGLMAYALLVALGTGGLWFLSRPHRR
jgi:hypothetical protein